MEKPFNLEAAKAGAEILYDSAPATFIAHLPDNKPSYRVVISCGGVVKAFTEDGRHTQGSKVSLTMAPRKEKTVGYRAYYRKVAGYGAVFKDVAWEYYISLKVVEQTPGFVRWIDTDWQHDEVLL